MSAHVFGTALTDRDYELLKRDRGISHELAETAQLRRVDTVTGREAVGVGDRDRAGDYAGILIPYFEPDTDRIRGYRLRRDNPPIGANGKPDRKYLSAPGDINMFYYPRRVALDWLAYASLKILLVEGEFKALSLWELAWHNASDAAERPAFLPIGLSGISNWTGKIGKQDGPNGERQDIKGPIPDFDKINWKCREVVLVGDSNAFTNEQVRIARFSLAKHLRELGAHVVFADIDPVLGANGIDDVCGRFGTDAALKIIASAYDPKAKKKSDSNSEHPSKTIIDEIPSVHDYASENVEFLVPGLIPKGTVTVISGESEAGKTTLTLYLVDHVARGTDILGGHCEPHPILFLTRENPSSYISDITRRLRIHDGPGTNLHIWGDWCQEQPPAPASSHVLAWVSQCQVSPLVVVDSLIAFFDGDNENDSAQMRAFLNQGRRLIQAGACGVIFLHHPGKAETAKDYRGSSDLKPAIDTGYKLTNSGDGKLDRLYLKAFKARFAQQQREMVLIYTENDGKASFIRDERPTAVAETNDQILANLLEQNPGIATGEFERAAVTKGVTQVRARRYLETGVNCGKILVDEGPHNKKCHRLARRQPGPAQ